MVLFGVGEVVGCFIMGYVVDRFGSRVAGLGNLLNLAILSVLIFFWLSEFRYTSLT
jgi:predicted MFS family arabinose efflux permease